jgi:hypothetical protein
MSPMDLAKLSESKPEKAKKTKAKPRLELVALAA